MNSLVSSFRSVLRFQPARAYAPCCRAYSTPVMSDPAAADAAASPSPSPPDSAASEPSSASSAAAGLDQVIRSISASKGKGRQPYGGAAQRGNPGRGAPRPSEFSSLYSTPSARSAAFAAGPSTPEQIWAFTPPVNYTPPVSLTSARSFAVRDGNVARAYRNLNRTLRENNVRLELRRQERFESPSNKRVRLNSERHRRRFKVAVGKAVALAMRMKDK
ncbi:hypothetical protein JCM3774_000174 [Rhodotorula dairenensis]